MRAGLSDFFVVQVWGSTGRRSWMFLLSMISMTRKGSSALAVVTSLFGIERLTLENFGLKNRLDATMFNSPGLEGPISLRLFRVHFHQNCLSLLPLFSLQRLQIDRQGGQANAPPSLLFFFLSSSLRHLRIDLSDGFGLTSPFLNAFNVGQWCPSRAVNRTVKVKQGETCVPNFRDAQRLWKPQVATG